MLVIIGTRVNVSNTKARQVEHQVTKLQIIASIYPLGYFASQIGLDRVEVTTITPAGVEPHDFEPSSKDIASLNSADLLILNGGKLEAWAEKIQDLLSSNRQKVIIASEGLETLQTPEIGNMKLDPHIWLDPLLAKAVSKRIAQSLKLIDPINTIFYEDNLHILEKKFDTLHEAFAQSLQKCEEDTIITSHAAFGYIASRYNIKQVSLTGLNPDEEVSPKKLAEISQFAKEHHIQYIFVEPLVSPKLSETIAQEIGAGTIVFNPLESLTYKEIEEGKDYFSVQQENLVSLRKALQCK